MLTAIPPCRTPCQKTRATWFILTLVALVLFCVLQQIPLEVDQMSALFVETFTEENTQSDRKNWEFGATSSPPGGSIRSKWAKASSFLRSSKTRIEQNMRSFVAESPRPGLSGNDSLHITDENKSDLTQSPSLAAKDAGLNPSGEDTTPTSPSKHESGRAPSTSFAAKAVGLDSSGVDTTHIIDNNESDWAPSTSFTAEVSSLDQSGVDTAHISTDNNENHQAPSTSFAAKDLEVNTTHTSNPNNNSDRAPSLYICGFVSEPLVDQYRLLFPRHEYLDVQSRDEARKAMSNNLSDVYRVDDVFLNVGMRSGPGCQGPWKDNRDFRSWVSRFPGKAVMVNGESFGAWNNISQGQVLQLGYYPDSDQSMTFRFVQTTLLSYGPDSWKMVFNHSLKPKSTKERFLIYAASHCVSYRDDAFRELALIDLVDFAGKCPKGSHETSQFRIAPEELRSGNSHWRDNTKHFGRYRFCLVMENTKKEGYITEKILNAFLAGCIPIYYGATEVFDIFNKEAFVYYNVSEPGTALELVKYLKGNDTAYDDMLQQPILANGTETIEKYFSFTEQIGNASLLKRIHQILGLAL